MPFFALRRRPKKITIGRIAARIYTRERRLTGQSGNALRNLLNPSLRHDSRGAVTFGMTAENKKTLPAEGGDHPATPMPPEFCPGQTGRRVQKIFALRSAELTHNQSFTAKKICEGKEVNRRKPEIH